MKSTFYITALAAVFAAVALTGPALAVDSYKDLSIQQRAMVDQFPVMPANASSSEHPLNIKTKLDRADGIYKPGEELKLTVETSDDAYIWVFDTGTSGRVHQIFPNKYEEDNFVRAGQSVTLPEADAEYQYIASEPEGVELLTVIASRDNGSLTQDLIDIETRAGPFLALQGNAVSFSKDLHIVIERDHPKSVTSHQVFRIVE